MLSPLDCHTAETNELVNGGRSLFILTVDMGGRLCYVITRHGDQHLRLITFGLVIVMIWQQS